MSTSPNHNIHILEAIRDDLHDFSSPDTFDGFFPIFCEWVLREWNQRPYYTTEVANFGHDLTHYPQKTDFLLREKARSYRDFIHANNGHHYASFHPSSGTSCETMEKNLYEFFHESMRLRALTFLEENYPEMDGEVFWNQIFCEDFAQRRELLIAEEISVYFGFYGLAAEPYTCHPEAVKGGGQGRFARWGLREFQKVLDCIRMGPLWPCYAPDATPERPYGILTEALSRRPFKKFLSQNGPIA